MLATLVGALPRDEQDWAFEFKWDGIRALVFHEPGSLRILSRNQIDITGRYPELRGLAAGLNSHRVVLDGEVIAFNEQGRVSFEALQQRMGVEKGRWGRGNPKVPIAYVVFDVLYLDGRSLLAEPYLQRREALQGLQLRGACWMDSPYTIGNGQRLWEASKEQQLEGIVAKRLNSPYEPGKRTRTWLKLKNTNRQEFVIGGWVPGQGRRSGRLGALVIGYYEHDRLISAGSVGTGFTDEMLDRLSRLLEPLAQDASPFEGGVAPSGAKFVRPELVCEVEFTEWTSATGQLRHPSFKGLRMDKEPPSVMRERPEP